MPPEYDRIREYIVQYDGDDYITIDRGGDASEAALQRVADAFPFPLPADYRDYLVSFGTLEVGGIEFAGVAGDSHLDVVNMRDDLVQYHDFPSTLIPIENQDGDSYVCIDADGVLHRWYPGNTDDVLDESLPVYLLRHCDELIEDESEDD